MAQTLTHTQLKAAHAVYLSLFGLWWSDEIELKFAVVVMTTMMSQSGSGWRVVGVTPAALARFAQEDFRRRPRGVQRAHLVDRITMVRKALSPKKPLDPEGLRRIWLDGDLTVLALPSEGARINLVEYISIDNPVGEMFQNKYVGFRFSAKREGEFLRNLHGSTVSADSASSRLRVGRLP